jgi:hypothetical protein
LLMEHSSCSQKKLAIQKGYIRQEAVQSVICSLHHLLFGFPLLACDAQTRSLECA